MAQSFELADKRTLCYLRSGAKGGVPLVWIHGTPSDLTPLPGVELACKEKGVELITFSRAGYGGSSRQKGRRVVDIVGDVQALIDHLGHKKVLIGGWSGGGPHALACAARLPGCIAAIATGSIAPYGAEGLDWTAGQGEDNVAEFEASLKGEQASWELLEPQRKDMIKASAAQIIEMMSSLFPEVDKQAILKDKTVGNYLEATGQGGLADNAYGWIDDNLAFVEDWGFDLSEISRPTFLYHGGADKMCPYAHGKWIAAHIPKKYITEHLYDAEGHLSVFLGKEPQIIDELLAVART